METLKVPIHEKATISIQEAVAYTGIGEHKMRELVNQRNCDFVIKIGNKNLIKRQKFEKFLENQNVL